MLKMGMQPAHPGEILKEMYLQPLSLTITETAEALGVAEKTFLQLQWQSRNKRPYGS